MAKKPSLLDQVAGEIPAKGPKPIMERIPPALADAIQKALSRSQSQRHADVGAFRKAILAAI